MGVKVGGGKLLAGTTIMDAQLSGYIKSRLSFQASASADTISKEFHYSYGVYLFYNLGYTAKATILGVVDWALGDRLAYKPDQRVDIYGPVEGTIPFTSEIQKRAELFGLEAPVNGLDAENALISNFSLLFPRVDDPSNAGMLNIYCPLLLVILRSYIKDPKKPDFSYRLGCPPGTTGDIQIPEMRCKFIVQDLFFVKILI
jgi:chitinase